MHLELAGHMYQKKSLFSQALTVDSTSTISPTQQVLVDGLMTLFLIGSLTVKGHSGSHCDRAVVFDPPTIKEMWTVLQKKTNCSNKFKKSGSQFGRNFVEVSTP